MLSIDRHLDRWCARGSSARGSARDDKALGSKTASRGAMEANGTSGVEREGETSATGALRATGWGEAEIRDKVRELVRKQPLLVVAAAGAAGAAVGGLVLSRLGRLAFIAAAGYVANELWHREGRIEIDRLISGLSTERSR